MTTTDKVTKKTNNRNGQTNKKTNDNSGQSNRKTNDSNRVRGKRLAK